MEAQEKNKEKTAKFQANAQVLPYMTLQQTFGNTPCHGLTNVFL